MLGPSRRATGIENERLSRIAAAGLFLLAFAARAVDPEAGDPVAVSSNIPSADPSAATGAAAVSAQGVRAAIDPAPGALIEPAGLAATSRTPIQEGARALGPQDFTKTGIEYLPDGRVHVQLNGQLQMDAFARLDAAGRAATWCAPSSSLAMRPLAPPQAQGTASTP